MQQKRLLTLGTKRCAQETVKMFQFTQKFATEFWIARATYPLSMVLFRRSFTKLELFCMSRSRATLRKEKNRPFDECFSIPVELRYSGCRKPKCEDPPKSNRRSAWVLAFFPLWSVRQWMNERLKRALRPVPFFNDRERERKCWVLSISFLADTHFENRITLTNRFISFG